MWSDESVVPGVFEVPRPDETVHIAACAHSSCVSLV